MPFPAGDFRFLLLCFGKCGAFPLTRVQCFEVEIHIQRNNQLHHGLHPDQHLHSSEAHPKQGQRPLADPGNGDRSRHNAQEGRNIDHKQVEGYVVRLVIRRKIHKSDVGIGRVDADAREMLENPDGCEQPEII